MIENVRTEAERLSYIGARESVQSQYGHLKAAVSADVFTCGYRLPERTSKPFRLVARQLAIRSKETPAVVGPSTLKSMDTSVVTVKVFRCKRAIVTDLKRVFEIFSPAMQAIIELMGPQPGEPSTHSQNRSRTS